MRQGQVCTCEQQARRAGAVKIGCTSDWTAQPPAARCIQCGVQRYLPMPAVHTYARRAHLQQQRRGQTAAAAQQGAVAVL